MIKEETISFSKEGASKNVEVRSNINWTVTTAPEAVSWLTAAKENEQLKLIAKPNTSVTRSTLLLLTGNGVRKEVRVQQLGVVPSILPSSREIKLDKFASDFEVVITANVEYEVALPDWITEKSKQELDNKSGYRHIFRVPTYEGAEPRTANIKIKSKNIATEINEIILVSQSGQYNNSNSQSIEGDIKLKIVRGTASSQHTGEGIEKSFDGDLSTIYHSNWSNGGANYFPITLEYFFENPENIDYMVYYPRTQGYNGYFKEVEILVATETNSAYTKVTDFNFEGNGKVTRVTFQNIVGAKSFKLIIKSGHGDGQGFASAAEIEFWKKNTAAFDPTKIFTDITCSELKPTVNEQDIEAISNPFYKNMALYMKANQYPSEFRVQEYRAWADPNVIRDYNRMQYSYSNLDNPTGISVEEGEDLIVFVGETHNRNLQIKIQNLDKPNGDGFDNASFHPLYQGTNKIKAGKKGLIYLQYQTADYASAPKIKVHFATGKVNGYYDKTKHTQPDDWNRLLNAATNKYFDVIGQYAHLCFPTESFKTHTGSKGKELIDIYDDMVDKTHIFAGTVGNRAMTNRAYFQVMYTAFMYCTAYRTSYNFSTMGTLCSPEKMKTDVWGPAHEIGHSHQIRPEFMWIGMTECTVNMNSMNIQTAWGIPTRLETESMQGEGGYNNRYEKAYNLGIVPKKAHGDIGDVFCQLVPFWQLNLYFSKVKNEPKFFTRVYEIFRQMPARSTYEDGKCQVDFTKNVSEVANADLTQFFERWGFYVPVDKEVNDYQRRQLTVTEAYANQIKGQIKSSGLPEITDRIEYICDSNWTYFRDKADVVKGTATKNGRQFTMRNWKNVVAYEVYDGQELIFASNKDTFIIKKDPTTNTKVYAIAYNGVKTEVTF